MRLTLELERDRSLIPACRGSFSTANGVQYVMACGPCGACIRARYDEPVLSVVPETEKQEISCPSSHEMQRVYGRQE